MTFSEIKEAVMFQTDNDRNDLGDFLPFLHPYINEGYDRLLYAWKQQHLKMDDETYVPLIQDSDTPQIPQWAHNGIVDWATWMIYRNGNGAKQQRGLYYRNNFNEIRNRLIGDGRTGNRFINIPT